jgi:hypothetical protein
MKIQEEKKFESVSTKISFEEALQAVGNIARHGQRGEFCQRHINELLRIASVIARTEGLPLPCGRGCCEIEMRQG